ncbi:hypothetical protein HY632_01865 [Candidatus Uhrbacteria bacterium]|nr:hypothetical protein [Candidatus Uhrbacteria bacterium]
MEWITCIGLLASFSTIVMAGFGYPHQIRQILRTRSSRDLSIVYLGASEVGWVLWLVYGILKRDWYIVTPNVLGAVFGAVTLSLWYRYRVPVPDSIPVTGA